MQENISQISTMRMKHWETTKSETNTIWEWVRKVGLDSSISRDKADRTGKSNISRDKANIRLTRRDKTESILNLNFLSLQTSTNSLMKSSKSGLMTLRSILFT